MSPVVSVVIPVFNEAGNIDPVILQTAAILRQSGRAFEIIVVDDGSTDATRSELESLASVVPECRTLPLPAHRGQGDALLAGLVAARGRWVVTLDGDGQNDPADIPALLEPVIAGAVDLTCGWRDRRMDRWPRRVMSKIANTVRRFVLHDQVHDAGCQLRAFRREIVAVLRPIELMQSFLPAFAVAAGFRVGELRVRHHPRRHGRSNYGVRRLWWRPAIAMLKLRRDLSCPGRRLRE